MNPARPLRDIFADPVAGGSGTDAAGPAEVLRAAGHPDLPDSLVAEAVGSYADTAPIEVAEHLSTYVMANSPVPLPDQAEVEPAQWLDAVSTAPTVTAEAHDPLLGLDPQVGPDPTSPDGPDHPDGPDGPDGHVGDVIDFGHTGADTGPDDALAPTADPGPDLPATDYFQPEDATGPDIPREAHDIHQIDDTPDDLDTWDDA